MATKMETPEITYMITIDDLVGDYLYLCKIGAVGTAYSFYREQTRTMHRIVAEPITVSCGGLHEVIPAHVVAHTLVTGGYDLDDPASLDAVRIALQQKVSAVVARLSAISIYFTVRIGGAYDYDDGMLRISGFSLEHGVQFTYSYTGDSYDPRYEHDIWGSDLFIASSDKAPYPDHVYFIALPIEGESRRDVDRKIMAFRDALRDLEHFMQRAD